MLNDNRLSEHDILFLIRYYVLLTYKKTNIDILVTEYHMRYWQSCSREKQLAILDKWKALAE